MQYKKTRIDISTSISKQHFKNRIRLYAFPYSITDFIALALHIEHINSKWYDNWDNYQQNRRLSKNIYFTSATKQCIMLMITYLKICKLANKEPQSFLSIVLNDIKWYRNLSLPPEFFSHIFISQNYKSISGRFCVYN